MIPRSDYNESASCSGSGSGTMAGRRGLDHTRARPRTVTRSVTSEAAAPRMLFALTGHPGNIGTGAITVGIKYDVDARGERFLVNVAEGGLPPVVVSIGWQAVLRD